MNLNSLTPADLDWKTWPDRDYRSELYDTFDMTKFMNARPKVRWTYGADRKFFYDLYVRLRTTCSKESGFRDKTRRAVDRFIISDRRLCRFLLHNNIGRLHS